MWIPLFYSYLGNLIIHHQVTVDPYQQQIFSHDDVSLTWSFSTSNNGPQTAVTESIQTEQHESSHLADKIVHIRFILDSSFKADFVEVTGATFCKVIWEKFEPWNLREVDKTLPAVSSVT